jgi:hypothetical protein
MRSGKIHHQVIRAIHALTQQTKRRKLLHVDYDEANGQDDFMTTKLKKKLRKRQRLQIAGL